MAWGWRAGGLLGLGLVLGCGRAFDGDEQTARLTAAPAPAGVAPGDWSGTFAAARDPHARVPDITVDLGPSTGDPGAWKVRISEHIANAEQPLTLRVDGISARRAVLSPFAGDVWGEASSEPDDGPAPGSAEIARVFEPASGIQLALYELAHGDPAVRYVRARTQADVAGADVMLSAQPPLAARAAR